MFKKILIANRGEIAVRIIRACKEWGIATVAIHSDVDRESMHVRLADESICVGPHQPTLSYLNIPAIMSAIELTGSEAVHPGYGFLSENFEFAKILEDNDIKFIGPSSNLIKMMGDKIEAKKVAKDYGLPVIEGSEGGIKDINEAKKICEKIGFPVLIKASGGGGGKGMKIVNKLEEFENLFLTAKQEAKKFFGNDDPLMCKRLENCGASAIMPLAAPIGSGLGIQNKTNIKILRHQTKVPLIIDAGIGQASDAVKAMELGCDAVLINTAIAKARKPFQMAESMKLAVISGRKSFLSGRIIPNLYGSPSTTKKGLI